MFRSGRQRPLQIQPDVSRWGRYKDVVGVGEEYLTNGAAHLRSAALRPRCVGASFRSHGPIRSRVFGRMASGRPLLASGGAGMSSLKVFRRMPWSSHGNRAQRFIRREFGPRDPDCADHRCRCDRGYDRRSNEPLLASAATEYERRPVSRHATQTSQRRHARPTVSEVAFRRPRAG